MLRKSIIYQFIVLFIVITSVLLLQAFKVGPLSISSYMSVLLLGYSVIYKEKVYIDKGFKLYLVFLGVMLLTSMLNGDFFYYKFWQSLLVYHLPCISFYLFSTIYIDDENKLKLSLLIILILFIINAVVSYMQYQNSALGWAIGQYVNDNLLAHTEEKLSYATEFLGMSVVGGITGFVVTNGYFVATLCPLVLVYSMGKLKIVKVDLGLMAVAATVIFTAYIIQQRTAFFLSFLFMCYFVVKRFRFWTFAILLAILIYFAFGSIDYDIDLGRLEFEGFADSSRSRLWVIFLEFLKSDNWILGGMNVNNDVYQHNAFLAAWYRHGFFTFLMFSYVYIYLVVRCLKPLLNRKNLMAFSFAAACLIYNAYSLTHSSGVQSGALLFWLPYALLLVSERIEFSKNS